MSKPQAVIEYNTGRVAEILKVDKDAVLYWLKTGKVNEPARNSHNHRVWSQEDLDAPIKYSESRPSFKPPQPVAKRPAELIE